MEFDWTKLKDIQMPEGEYAQAFNDSLQKISQVSVSLPAFNQVVESFNEWRCGKAPSLVSLLGAVCEEFHIDADHEFIPPAMAASILGDIPHDNPYHNNHHFREVVTLTMLLAKRHNELTRSPAMRLDAEDVLILFMAACIHDFAHEGHGNVVNGVHMPSFVEKQSLAKAKPFLMASGLPENVFSVMEIMVVATDVSRNEQGRSPAGIVRDIFLAHMYNNTDVVQCDLFYAPLKAHEKFALMTMLLCEADVAMSSGLRYDFSKYMTRLVAEENDSLLPAASTLFGFMTVICHGGYLTMAARDLLEDNFQSILVQAERDSQKGILYTPK